MKKGFIVTSTILAALFVGQLAEAAEFNNSLYFGMYNNPEVRTLQEFLVNEGYLTVAPTGNYLSLTKQAVIKLQVDLGIINTGYFGPLTRVAVNAKIALTGGSNIVTGITVESVSDANPASSLLSGTKIIRWNKNAYPGGVSVSINLIRKISDSPVSFEFVRRIANTVNDGQETWQPLPSELGSDLYIEVVCNTSAQFKGGCELNLTPSKVL